MSVTPEELRATVDAGRAPTILDVRSHREFMHGHVPGAIHIPFWLLPARISGVPASRDSAVVVYCGHGPRAWFARAILRWYGFRDVALLEGHMSGWKRAGLPEEK